MLFDKLNQVLTSTVEAENQLNTEIEALEAKLAELRLEVARNKERQQHQTTLIGGFQSALVQVVKAVSAASENSELIEAFWEEIEAIKLGQVTFDLAGYLPETPDPENTPTQTPTIDPETDLEDVIDISLGVIDIESETPAQDQIIDISPANINDFSTNDFSTGEDMNLGYESTLKYLNTLKLTELRKLGAKLGVKGAARSNRAVLEEQLSEFEVTQIMTIFESI